MSNQLKVLHAQSRAMVISERAIERPHPQKTFKQTIRLTETFHMSEEHFILQLNSFILHKSYLCRASTSRRNYCNLLSNSLTFRHFIKMALALKFLLVEYPKLCTKISAKRIVELKIIPKIIKYNAVEKCNKSTGTNSIILSGQSGLVPIQTFEWYDSMPVSPILKMLKINFSDCSRPHFLLSSPMTLPNLYPFRQWRLLRNHWPIRRFTGVYYVLKIANFVIG